jgi:hypothetical protein
LEGKKAYIKTKPYKDYGEMERVSEALRKAGLK